MGNIHSINIGGSTYVIEPNFVKILDKRDTVAHAPSYYGGQRLTASFENNGGPTSGWNSMLSIYGYQGSNYKVWQIGSNADNNTTNHNLYFRTSNSITNNTWHPWKRVITDKDTEVYVNSLFGKPNYTYLLGIRTNLVGGNDHINIYGVDSDCPFAYLYSTTGYNDGSHYLWASEMRSNTFKGSLSGNATTATSATNATRSKTSYLTYIKCETTTNQSYLINFGNKKTGDTYTYSSSKLTFNPSTGELQTYNLRLKNSGNYGSYLKFGDNNYCYIWESPDDTLRIHSLNGLYVTNSVTATNFEGNLLGKATSASSIYVTYNPTSNNSYSVPFMDYGHTQNSKIYSDNTFKYNPYTNTLTAKKFAGKATNAVYADQVAIHTSEFIRDSGLCSLIDMNEVPVILGGCDCAMFFDTINAAYFGLMTDYHPQKNNSNWLRYNFNDKTLKSTNFEGNLIGNATSATTATNANKAKVNVTSTYANYPLILGPSTLAGGTVSMGNKSLYTDSANNLYYNPNTKTLTATNTYIDNAYIQNIKTKNHVSINVPNTAYSTLNNIWSKPFFMTYCSGQWAEHNYRFRVYDTQNPISIAGEFVFNVRRTTSSTYAYLTGDLYWETLNNPAAAKSIIACQGPPVEVTYNTSGSELTSNYTSGNVTLYFNWPKGSDVWLTPNIELISERTAVSENSYYKMLTTYSWTGNGVLKSQDNKSSLRNKSFKITSNAKDILNTTDTNTFIQSVRVLTESQYSSISKDANTLYLVI